MLEALRRKGQKKQQTNKTYKNPKNQQNNQNQFFLLHPTSPPTLTPSLFIPLLLAKQLNQGILHPPMLRRELEENLKDLSHELTRRIPSFLNDALVKVNIKSISNEEAAKLADELRFPFSNDFIFNFTPKLLETLINIQKQERLTNNLPYPPKTVGDLVMVSAYPVDIQILKRHRVLAKIVECLNTSIFEFFRLQQKQIEFLIEQQKRLEKIENEAKETQELAPKFKNYPRPTQPIEIHEIESDSAPEPVPELDEMQRLANYREPTEQDLRCPFCICAKLEIIVDESFCIRCIVCKNYFHVGCLRLDPAKPKRTFTCPECILPRLDQLHQVSPKQTYLQPALFTPSLKPETVYSFYVNKRPGLRQLAEVRILRIDGGSEDVQWPDIGDLHFNSYRISEFKPLAQLSSLKKRKDETIQLEVTEKCNNLLWLREGPATTEIKKTSRVTLGDNYMLAVFGVDVYSAERLIEKVRGDTESYMGIEQCKLMIKLFIQQSQNDEVAIESIKVPLQCVFDMSLIETPARGNLCEHIQCFSLEHFIIFMAQMTPRRWRCPICKNLILGFHIDSYQLQILTIIKQNDLQLTEIQFDMNAQVENEQIRKTLNQALFSQQLPEHLVSNRTARILPLEILAQRVLKIPNTVGQFCKVKEDVETKKKVKIEKVKQHEKTSRYSAAERQGTSEGEAILID